MYHSLLTLFHALFLIMGSLRLLKVLITSLSIFRRELKCAMYEENRIIRIIQFIKYLPFISPFWVSYGILSCSLYIPSEKVALVTLEFLMAFVRVILFLPLEILGVPDCVCFWASVLFYAPLRGKFGEIEFSERVLSVLREGEERDEEGDSTDEKDMWVD